MTIGRHDWKRAFHGLLEVALVLTAVFSLVTVFDEWHRLITLFAHFRVQYLGAAALLCIVFAVLRGWGYVALAAATVALNAWYVLPWYFPVERPAARASDLRVLNANVLATNGSSAKFRALVDRAVPDVIVLQEVTPAWLASLDGLATRYPHRVVEARDDAFGIALFSRLPLEAAAIHHSAPRGYPEIVATVVAGDRRVHVLGVHAANPVSDGGYAARNLQLDALGRLAAATPAPVLIAGDLNVSLWAHPYRRLERVSGLRNAREGFGVAPTWPVFFPPAMIPIDHFLVSLDLAVAEFHTGPDIGSDHLPLLVVLRVGD